MLLPVRFCRPSRPFIEWDLRASDFDYALPADLIAQRPLPSRSASRMLVLDRGEGAWNDSRFRELPQLLRRGDCLAVNNSRVLAARLLGRRRTPSGTPGGKAEVLLIEPESPGSTRWRALVRPGRRLRPGAVVDAGEAEIRVVGQADYGIRIVEFPAIEPRGIERLLEECGHVPLPPYIRRGDDAADRHRYQTVFARKGGSIAAPTAGLHFDEPVVNALRKRGATIAEITLHVGLGTFRPVSAEQVENHSMHAERFEVPARTAGLLGAARRIVAVGTTSVRALESVAASNGGAIRAACGETDLFIRPGFRFQAVDALLTNFHLPRSTLLMLVSAFAGAELVRAAYEHAVRERYRFYSYGDCMLIV